MRPPFSTFVGYAEAKNVMKYIVVKKSFLGRYNMPQVTFICKRITSIEIWAGFQNRFPQYSKNF